MQPIPSTNPGTTSSQKPTPRLLALLPGGLALLLYLLTCSPTVNSTDSGELITVAYTGGIAHPPGYPLYTLLGILVSHLPLGDVAWRMNMLSAIFAAVAVALFYLLNTDTISGMLTFKRWATPPAFRPRSGASRPRANAAQPRKGSDTRNTNSNTLTANPQPGDEASIQWIAIAGGMAASGLLAVSLTFWNWATQAKFYSLHCAFVAALLWLALLARRAIMEALARGTVSSPRWPFSQWTRSIKLLHLLAFAIGLALTNHFLTFLVLPGIIVLLLSPLRYARDVLRLTLRHAGTLIVALLIPLLLYLYLPIRASMDPLIAWGLPDTFGGFFRQVTAESYQGYFGATSFGDNFADALVYAANQFGLWVGLLLLIPIALGLIYLWREDRGLFTATVVAALINLFVVLNYNIREIATYYVPLYMIFLWWAGLGIAEAISLLARRFPTSNDRATNPFIQSPAAPLAIGALLPLIGLVLNLGAAGHRDNYTAELFIRNTFKNLRPNAVVLTNYWDLTSGSFYFQHVLNERPDVAIIDKTVMRQPFYLEYLERTHPDLIAANAGPFAQYKAFLNEFIETGRAPAGISDAYLSVLTGFIDTNLGQRPVYAHFVVAGGDATEAQEVTALLESHRSQLVPDGIGYRIATGLGDLAAQDPQFDLRGITTQQVPLDEIEASVLALYPPSLQAIGSYLQNSAAQADKDLGATLLAQAQQLQPLAARQDARPHLR